MAKSIHYNYIYLIAFLQIKITIVLDKYKNYFFCIYYFTGDLEHCVINMFVVAMTDLRAKPFFE